MTSGLGARRVKVVAAAKHHTVIATEGGEVFTWGSNRGKQRGMVHGLCIILCIIKSIVAFKWRELEC